MAKPKKQEETNQVAIERVIRSAEDAVHPLDKLINSEDAPEIRSVGFMRISEASNTWISYVMITKGNKVIKVEVDEPNLRVIAEESAKIQFVQLFIDQE